MAAPSQQRPPPLPPRPPRQPRQPRQPPLHAVGEATPRPSVKGTVEDGRVHRPAGAAWLTILVTFLAGLLLNADGVAHIADTQPLGWQRSTARAATRPFQSVSHALLLNRPRAWLAEATGAPQLLDAGHDPKAAPTTTAAPGATTTTLPPLQVRTPTSEDPLRVYLTGDSFLADVSRGLSATLGTDHRWNVATDAKPGTGLSRPEIIDWPDRIRHRLPTDAEIVVVGFGGNDAQDMLASGEHLKLGEPGWEAEYQNRIAQVLDIVARPGRTIVWVGVPVATAKNIEKARPAMTRAAKAELAKHPGSLFLETAATLSGGDGQYKDFLTIDGEPKRVRASDGYHLSPAGATLLGRTLVHLIGTVWPVGGQGGGGATSASTSTSSP
jgi:hypothetical protein